MSERITLQSFFEEDGLERALIIQNVLGGPLVLEDLDDLILYSGETFVWDLNPDDERRLRRSTSLRKAIRNNLVRQLNSEQYERELELEEVRTRDEEEQHEAEMMTIDLNDDIAINAERIDMTRDARRAQSGGQKRKAMTQELKRDPVQYAKLQAQLRAQNPDLSPHDFARMVDENSFSPQQLSYSQEHNPGRATVARPDGRYGNNAEHVQMGNFGRDGYLEGGQRETANSYAHRGYRDSYRESGYSDGFAEEVDLGMDDDMGGGRIARI